MKGRWTSIEHPLSSNHINTSCPSPPLPVVPHLERNASPSIDSKLARYADIVVGTRYAALVKRSVASIEQIWEEVEGREWALERQEENQRGKQKRKLPTCRTVFLLKRNQLHFPSLPLGTCLKVLPHCYSPSPCLFTPSLYLLSISAAIIQIKSRGYALLRLSHVTPPLS